LLPIAPLCLAELEKLTQKRDQIVADAREVRRAHVGLKMKLEVLTKESSISAGTSTAIERADNRNKSPRSKTGSTSSRKRFAELKVERIQGR
jgi:hypothetical protein